MPGFEIRGKRVLITGCNTGIGKATATELARRGARVVITARAGRGEAALAEIRAKSGGEVELLDLELASLASVRRVAAEVLARYPELHVLILNAGVVGNTGRAETADGFELMFGVNHLAHFELTRLLLERVRASAPARIIVLTSAGYRYARDGLDFDDLQSTRREYKALEIYGHSKLANILFTRELARRLAGTGVTVNTVHPGYVATELGLPRPGEGVSAQKALATARAEKPELAHLPPPVTPEQGAATSVFLASSPEVEGVSGEYFVDCKRQSLLPAALDAAAAQRLWQVSEQLLGSVR
jgi:NAD(P)-dependent dehydrogenase (short-subunit alcohol dehydrogenase family)